MTVQDNSSRSMYYTFGIQRQITGGRAHVAQFIANTTASNWRVWGSSQTVDPADSHGLIILPQNVLKRMRVLQDVDVVYSRVEDQIYWSRFSRFACRPWNRVIGNPLVAWEINAGPEYGLTRGLPETEVAGHLAEMKRLARDCDVAFCVSDKIAEYAESQLGIREVVVAPNGSDPDRFSPTAPPVPYLQSCEDRLRVVWIGGGSIGWHDFDLLHDIAQSLWKHDRGERIRIFVISGDCPRIGDMPPNVTCVGQRPYDELPNWLSGMHVGLCLYRGGASDYCSPLKLYDYMASGLPILSTPQPQVASVLNAVGQGHAILKRADEFVDALIQLEHNRDRARENGKVLRDHLVQHCTWKHTVGHILEEIVRRL